MQPILRLTKRTTAPRFPSSICHACRRAYSESTPPPLLTQLRNDLKTSLKAKDKERLNVLRGLLAEVTNAGKTSNPIQTDMQLLSLLRKRSAAAKAAGEECRAAGREDLVERELGQARILDEYAQGVEVVPVEEVRRRVGEVVERLQAEGAGAGVNAGSVLKALFASGGVLDGLSVDRGVVPGIVKEVLAAK